MKMTHPSPSAYSDENEASLPKEMPALGLFHSILPPLPPLGSRWAIFPLWVLARQLQSGAIAELESFENIFQFWNFGTSEHSADVSWLYWQLMSGDTLAPHASETPLSPLFLSPLPEPASPRRGSAKDITQVSGKIFVEPPASIDLPSLLGDDQSFSESSEFGINGAEEVSMPSSPDPLLEGVSAEAVQGEKNSPNASDKEASGLFETSVEALQEPSSVPEVDGADFTNRAEATVLNIAQPINVDLGDLDSSKVDASFMDDSGSAEGDSPILSRQEAEFTDLEAQSSLQPSNVQPDSTLNWKDNALSYPQDLVAQPEPQASSTQSLQSQGSKDVQTLDIPPNFPLDEAPPEFLAKLSEVELASSPAASERTQELDANGDLPLADPISSPAAIEIQSQEISPDQLSVGPTLEITGSVDSTAASSASEPVQNAADGQSSGSDSERPLAAEPRLSFAAEEVLAQQGRLDQSSVDPILGTPGFEDFTAELPVTEPNSDLAASENIQTGEVIPAPLSSEPMPERKVSGVEKTETPSPRSISNAADNGQVQEARTESSPDESTPPNTAQSEGGLRNWLKRGVSWLLSTVEGTEDSQIEVSPSQDFSQPVSKPEVSPDLIEPSIIFQDPLERLQHNLADSSLSEEWVSNEGAQGQEPSEANLLDASIESDQADPNTGGYDHSQRPEAPQPNNLSANAPALRADAADRLKLKASNRFVQPIEDGQVPGFDPEHPQLQAETLNAIAPDQSQPGDQTQPPSIPVVERFSERDLPADERVAGAEMTQQLPSTNAFINEDTAHFRVEEHTVIQSTTDGFNSDASAADFLRSESVSREAFELSPGARTQNFEEPRNPDASQPQAEIIPGGQSSEDIAGESQELPTFIQDASQPREHQSFAQLTDATGLTFETFQIEQPTQTSEDKEQNSPSSGLRSDRTPLPVDVERLNNQGLDNASLDLPQATEAFSEKRTSYSGIDDPTIIQPVGDESYPDAELGVTPALFARQADQTALSSIASSPPDTQSLSDLSSSDIAQDERKESLEDFHPSTQDLAQQTELQGSERLSSLDGVGTTEPEQNLKQPIAPDSSEHPSNVLANTNAAESNGVSQLQEPVNFSEEPPPSLGEHNEIAQETPILSDSGQEAINPEESLLNPQENKNSIQPSVLSRLEQDTITLDVAEPALQEQSDVINPPVSLRSNQNESIPEFSTLTESEQDKIVQNSVSPTLQEPDDIITSSVSVRSAQDLILPESSPLNWQEQENDIDSPAPNGLEPEVITSELPILRRPEPEVILPEVAAPDLQVPDNVINPPVLGFQNLDAFTPESSTSSLMEQNTIVQEPSAPSLQWQDQGIASSVSDSPAKSSMSPEPSGSRLAEQDAIVPESTALKLPEQNITASALDLSKQNATAPEPSGLNLSEQKHDSETSTVRLPEQDTTRSERVAPDLQDQDDGSNLPASGIHNQDIFTPELPASSLPEQEVFTSEPLAPSLELHNEGITSSALPEQNLTTSKSSTPNWPGPENGSDSPAPNGSEPEAISSELSAPRLVEQNTAIVAGTVSDPQESGDGINLPASTLQNQETFLPESVSSSLTEPEVNTSESSALELQAESIVSPALGLPEQDTIVPSPSVTGFLEQRAIPLESTVLNLTELEHHHELSTLRPSEQDTMPPAVAVSGRQEQDETLSPPVTDLLDQDLIASELLTPNWHEQEHSIDLPVSDGSESEVISSESLAQRLTEQDETIVLGEVSTAQEHGDEVNLPVSTLQNQETFLPELSTSSLTEPEVSTAEASALQIPEQGFETPVLGLSAQDTILPDPSVIGLPDYEAIPQASEGLNLSEVENHPELPTVRPSERDAIASRVTVPELQEHGDSIHSPALDLHNQDVFIPEAASRIGLVSDAVVQEASAPSPPLQNEDATSSGSDSSEQPLAFPEPSDVNWQAPENSVDLAVPDRPEQETATSEESSLGLQSQDSSLEPWISNLQGQNEIALESFTPNLQEQENRIEASPLSQSGQNVITTDAWDERTSTDETLPSRPERLINGGVLEDSSVFPDENDALEAATFAPDVPSVPLEPGAVPWVELDPKFPSGTSEVNPIEQSSPIPREEVSAPHSRAMPLDHAPSKNLITTDSLDLVEAPSQPSAQADVETSNPDADLDSSASPSAEKASLLAEPLLAEQIDSHPEAQNTALQEELLAPSPLSVDGQPLIQTQPDDSGMIPPAETPPVSSSTPLGSAPIQPNSGAIASDPVPEINHPTAQGEVSLAVPSLVSETVEPQSSLSAESLTADSLTPDPSTLAAPPILLEGDQPPTESVISDVQALQEPVTLIQDDSLPLVEQTISAQETRTDDAISRAQVQNEQPLAPEPSDPFSEVLTDVVIASESSHSSQSQSSDIDSASTTPSLHEEDAIAPELSAVSPSEQDVIALEPSVPKSQGQSEGIEPSALNWQSQDASALEHWAESNDESPALSDPSAEEHTQNDITGLSVEQIPLEAVTFVQDSPVAEQEISDRSDYQEEPIPVISSEPFTPDTMAAVPTSPPTIPPLDTELPLNPEFSNPLNSLEGLGQQPEWTDVNRSVVSDPFEREVRVTAESASFAAEQDKALQEEHPTAAERPSGVEEQTVIQTWEGEANEGSLQSESSFTAAQLLELRSVTGVDASDDQPRRTLHFPAPDVLTQSTSAPFGQDESIVRGGAQDTQSPSASSGLIEDSQREQPDPQDFVLGFASPLKTERIDAVDTGQSRAILGETGVANSVSYHSDLQNHSVNQNIENERDLEESENAPSQEFATLQQEEPSAISPERFEQPVAESTSDPSIQPIEESVNETGLYTNWAIAAVPLGQNTHLLSHLTLSEFLQSDALKVENGSASDPDERTPNFHPSQKSLEPPLNATTDTATTDTLAHPTAEASPDQTKADPKQTSSETEFPNVWNSLEELVSPDSVRSSPVTIQPGSNIASINTFSFIPDNWSSLEDLISPSVNRSGSQSSNGFFNENSIDSNFQNGWSNLSELIHSLSIVEKNEVSTSASDNHEVAGNITGSPIHSDIGLLPEVYPFLPHDELSEMIINELQTRTDYDFQIKPSKKMLYKDTEALFNSRLRDPIALEISKLEQTLEEKIYSGDYDDSYRMVVEIIDSMSKLNQREIDNQ